MIVDPREIVREVFEHQVSSLFGLGVADSSNSGAVPDLVSRDGSFYVEVKASAYNNGGVIKSRQLYRFNEAINVKRFYAFAYHPIGRDMKKDYKTKDALKQALKLRSLFVLPFSVVKAYFEKAHKRNHPEGGRLVTLAESKAQAIFEGDMQMWEFLSLDKEEYRAVDLHEKVHLMTRQGHLEQQILGLFRSEFV